MNDFVENFQRLIDRLNEFDSIYAQGYLHKGADLDAYCSALGFFHLLNFYVKKLEYTLHSDSINMNVKAITIKGRHPVDSFTERNPQLICFFDMGTKTQLGKLYKQVARISATNPVSVIVDHHNINEFSTDFKFLDEVASSTCLIITRLFSKLKAKVSPEIATYLIAGHLYDSSRFLHGSTLEVFHQIVFLLEHGGDFTQAQELVHNPASKGEIIAKVKAFTRLKYASKGDLIVCTTVIKAFEASVARTLIKSGVTVSFVIGVKEKETKGSARRTKYFDIDLHSIVAKLAKIYEGSGGGHKEAAGMTIPRKLSHKEIQMIQEQFMELVLNH